MNSVWTATLVAVALAAFPLLVGGNDGLPIVLGAVGVAAVIGAVFTARIGLLIVGAVFFLGQVVVVLEGEVESTWWTVGYAAGLLILLEVAVGAIELRAGAAGSAGPQLVRIVAVGSLAAVAALAVFAIAELPLERGLLVQAAGVGAMAALVLGVALLARD